MAGYSTLPSLRSQELSVAVHAGPIAVDKRHGIAADRAIRRRPLLEEGKVRQLDIVFVHDFAILRNR